MTGPLERDLPSYPVDVSTLPAAGFPIRLVPEPGEAAALAAFAGVSAVEGLAATLLLRGWQREGVEITGTLEAVIEQPCVVTLEPVTQRLEQPVHRLFLPERSRLVRNRAEGEMVLDPDGEDPPDTFSGTTIDVWAVVIETLLLGIDPFPRSPAAPEPPSEDEDTRAADSPFAALAALKDRR